MRQLDFNDSQSSSTEPNASFITAGKLPVYSNPAGYVSAKGTDATEGDIFWNSTDDKVNTYTGTSWVEGESEKNNATTSDPTTDDDASNGYSVNSWWVNSSSSTAFICTDSSNSAAVWVEIGKADDISTNAADILTNAGNLTTHADATTAIHGITGAVVGTTDTQVITGKDIDGTSNPNWNIGDGTDVDITISADITTGNIPKIKYNITDDKWQYSNDGVSFCDLGADSSTFNVAYVKEVKANNNAGGTFTAGSWQTRVLNTVEGDTSIVSLASNIFTLDTGIYFIRVNAPAYNVNRHVAKLVRDPSGTPSNEIIGSPKFCSSGNYATTDSIIIGKVIVTGSTDFSIQHYCSTTQSSNGFGIEANVGVVETYTQIEIIKFT